MSEFEKIIDSGRINFFGYSYQSLPKGIENANHQRVKKFFKRAGQKINLENFVDFDYYSGRQGTAWEAVDMVFFDQDAVKSLCIGFPSQSKFVMISLKYPQYYCFIIFGILYRLLTKQISLCGVVNLNNGAKLSPWIMLKCKNPQSNSFSISKEIGISGFLDFLSKHKIRYVVPRFYESLPKLMTPDADFDIIVDSQKAVSVKEFLQENPGEIHIDVYTDNGTDYHGMSYIPPQKAVTVLNRTETGPGGASIPSKQDALNLVLYHALYNKGYLSGISSIHALDVAQGRDNKYKRVIKALCADLDIKVGETMEEMDLYMAKVGWKPGIDTLAKISQWNEWVRDHHIVKSSIFIPLYVLILKEGIKSNSSDTENLVKFRCGEEGLMILEERELVGEVKKNAITEVRGGIWNDSLTNNEDISKFYPYKILVVWDILSRPPGEFARVKEKIRHLIDLKKPSLIHSSDNYHESIDYIKICIPDSVKKYDDEAYVLQKFSKFSVKTKGAKQRLNALLFLMRKYSTIVIIKIFGH